MTVYNKLPIPKVKTKIRVVIDICFKYGSISDAFCLVTTFLPLITSIGSINKNKSCQGDLNARIV